MPIVADAAAKIGADMTDFNRDLKRGGEKGVQTLGQQIKSVFSKRNLAVAGFAAGAAGLGLFVAGLGQAVKDLINIERLNAQTAAAIRSTGGAAKVTADEITGLAGEIEKMSGIEAESIQEGQNLLLTFKNIRNEAGAGNDIFNQATRAMVDLGVAMGTDAKSGAIQLGKALNDPVKGLAALSRVGITFSKAQEDMIRGFVETGDLLSAQKIMLAELESQFGGSAEAFGDTTAGRIAKFQNSIGDMFESIILGAVKVAEVLNTPFETDGLDSLESNVNAALDANQQWATGSEDSADRVSDSMTQVNNAVATNMGGVVSTMETQGERIRSEWEKTTRFLPEAVKARFDEIRTAGFQQQVEYAKGLLDAQDRVKVAIEAALQIVEDEMTKQEEIAYLSGQRGTLMLARGIASAEGKTASVAAIDGALALVRQRLGELGVEFYTSGVNLGNSFAAGIDSRYGVVRDAAGRLSQAVRGQIGIRSEPEDHDSPLYGHMKWGGNLVKDFVQGIYGELGTGARAAGALAATLVPSMAMPATAMAAGMAGGVTNQWILNVGGVEKVFTSRDDFMNALDDLGAFGDGRLA